MPDAMGRLTPAELAEPDITLVIPEDRDWQIPKAIMDELRLFGGRMVAGNWVVTVPAYRYREWLKKAATLPAK